MKSERLRRLLQLILPMILLGVMLFCSSRVNRVFIGAGTGGSYARATVLEVEEDQSGEKPFQGTQRVLVEITSGEYEGQQCILNNPNSYQNGAFCVPGLKIIAFVRASSDGILGGSVYNYDRTQMVYLLLGLFALALILVGGKKGVAALYALVFTFICVLCMYIPLLYVGMNGILAAILTAVIILAASIYILNGWSVKTVCAIVGTTVGIAVSGILAMAVGGAFSLSGFNMEEVESLVFIAADTKLDVANILYAGVLIACLGAVMDVSVSMVAAMWEVYEKVPGISPKELFASGMRVGHDMIGTMSNTLILAYIGSATGVVLSVYSFQMSYLQIMGHNAIIIEIVSGLCGTVGVILTVPVQALIMTLVLKSKRWGGQQNGS